MRPADKSSPSKITMPQAESATPSPRRWEKPASASTGWRCGRFPEAASRKNCSTASGFPPDRSLPLSVRSVRSRVVELLHLRLLVRRQNLKHVSEAARPRDRHVRLDGCHFGRFRADQAFIEGRRRGCRMQRLACRHRPLADCPRLLLTGVDDLLDLFTLRVGQVQLAKGESCERPAGSAWTSASAARTADAIGAARSPTLALRGGRLILLLACHRQRG